MNTVRYPACKLALILLLAAAPGACQPEEKKGFAGTPLSRQESEDAFKTAVTAAGADRCSVPHRQTDMINAMLERARAAGGDRDRLIYLRRVYDAVYDDARRTLSEDRAWCAKERLAEIKAEVARLGG